METTNAAMAAEIINNSKDMTIGLRIEAADAANVSASFKLEDCGEYTAKSDDDLLIVNCDLAGDENENPVFVNLLKESSGFYVKEAARLLKTYMTFYAGGKEISGTQVIFTPFPKFCSFVTTVKDIEIK